MILSPIVQLQEFDLTTDNRRLRQQCIAIKCHFISRQGLERAESYLHIIYTLLPRGTWVQATLSLRKKVIFTYNLL
jgi:hypothetical protein